MNCCNPYVRAVYIYIYVHTWVEFHPFTNTAKIPVNWSPLFQAKAPFRDDDISCSQATLETLGTHH